MKKINVKELVVKGKRFWQEPPKGRFLNLKEILCLGGASLGVSFICNIVNMYVTIGQLPLLYDMGDYGTLHATIVYLTSCVGGMLLTPLYGRMVQRTKSKWGRYKPYIMFIAPVVALLGALSAWSPQELSTAETTAYVYCICIPTLLVWNLWFNLWNLFPGVITPNQQERVDIWSPIGLVMGFAPTIMNVLKDLFAGIWGDIVAARIFGVTSAVVGVVCVIALVKVKERVFVTEKENNENKIGTLQGLKLVFRNKPLMILTIALVLGCMKGTIDVVWHIIARVKYAENMADAAKIFGAVSMVVGFAATPNMLLLPLFTRKMNNRAIMIMWQAFNTSAYLILALIGFQNLQPGTTSAVIITALRFVASFNAIGSLQPLMLSEISDYQQHMSGYRLEGFIQTMAYSVPLVFTQACALIPAVIQGKVGFNPNNYLITEGANGIPANEMPQNFLSDELIEIADKYANIAIWISVASGALMLIALCFYTLSKKKHAEIVEALKAQSVNTEDIEREKGDLTFLSDDESEQDDADGGDAGEGAADTIDGVATEADGFDAETADGGVLPGSCGTASDDATSDEKKIKEECVVDGGDDNEQ